MCMKLKRNSKFMSVSCKHFLFQQCNLVSILAWLQTHRQWSVGEMRRWLPSLRSTAALIETSKRRRSRSLTTPLLPIKTKSPHHLGFKHRKYLNWDHSCSNIQCRSFLRLQSTYLSRVGTDRLYLRHPQAARPTSNTKRRLHRRNIQDISESKQTTFLFIVLLLLGTKSTYSLVSWGRGELGMSSTNFWFISAEANKVHTHSTSKYILHGGQSDIRINILFLCIFFHL